MFCADIVDSSAIYNNLVLMQRTYSLHSLPSENKDVRCIKTRKKILYDVNYNFLQKLNITNITFCTVRQLFDVNYDFLQKLNITNTTFYMYYPT